MNVSAMKVSTLTRGEKWLAVLGLALPWLSSLVTWGWSASGNGALGYMWVSIAVVVSLVAIAGVVVGTRRGIPLWAYAWFIPAFDAFYGLWFSVVRGALTRAVALKPTSAVAMGSSILYMGIFLALFLGIAYSLSSRRGARHGLTFCALSLPVFFTTFTVSSSETARWGIYPYLDLMVASTGLMAVGALVWRYLEAIEDTLRLFWSLIAAVLFAMYLKVSLSGLALGFEGSATIFVSGLFAWAGVLVPMALAWLAIWRGDVRRRRAYGT